LIHVFLPWRTIVRGFKRLFVSFETLLGTGRFTDLAKILIGLIVAWHIYTPIHELLHVAACWIGGGEVTELALAPQYGAHLLRHIFPFIVPESEYAGQLTGFSTPNDWVYAFVDFLPYVLSLVGMIVVDYSARKMNHWLIGSGYLLALVPFMSIPGDFYEAASLAVTRWAHGLDSALSPRRLISDDVFKLIADLGETGELNLMTGSMVGLGLLIALVLTLYLFAIQVWLADGLRTRQVRAQIESSENTSQSGDSRTG